jgi:hypothetical protein
MALNVEPGLRQVWVTRLNSFWLNEKPPTEVRTERLIEGVLGLWGQEDIRWLNHALLSDRPRPPIFR